MSWKLIISSETDSGAFFHIKQFTAVLVRYTTVLGPWWVNGPPAFLIRRTAASQRFLHLIKVAEKGRGEGLLLIWGEGKRGLAGFGSEGLPQTICLYSSVQLLLEA